MTDVKLPPLPWSDDLEAWLEVRETGDIEREIQEYARLAVLQERERCAKVCEFQVFKNPISRVEEGENALCNLLADLIRSGEPA